MRRRARPPLPPLVLCAPADPASWSTRFLDDVALVAGAAAVGRLLPPFVPLGGAPRSGERLVLCDASGAPLRLSESSGMGCPRRRSALLPIGPLWRAAFDGNAHNGADDLGGARESGGGSPPPLPLWLCYTPGACYGGPPWMPASMHVLTTAPRFPTGACFGVPREGVLRARGGESAAAYWRRLRGELAAPRTYDVEAKGEAWSRLWRYVFLGATVVGV